MTSKILGGAALHRTRKLITTQIYLWVNLKNMLKLDCVKGLITLFQIMWMIKAFGNELLLLCCVCIVLIILIVYIYLTFLKKSIWHMSFLPGSSHDNGTFGIGSFEANAAGKFIYFPFFILSHERTCLKCTCSIK